MKIVDSQPPNIKAIEAVFGKLHVGVCFTYGDTIYAPGVTWGVPDHLVAHEEVHEVQQGRDPAAWWDRYLVDIEFRLAQEVEAYQHQWDFLVKHYGRPERRRILRKIADDLSGPIYGRIVSRERATQLIKGGE